jgi:N-acetyl-alpha-D-muramate 1-phosphate uridylyltransferase
VSGKPLVDWGLDALAQAGVEKAVVNVHYLPDQLIAHLAARTHPRIVVSDERDRLLDSGGGIVKALPELGPEPFYVVNADTFWIDGREPNLLRLANAWNEARMDILLMLADVSSATGHSGGSDFVINGDGSLRRAGGSAPGGMIYAGAAIIHPRIFARFLPEPHSLNREFDATIEAGRLYGCQMRGSWITVGTPDAIAPAEAAVARANGVSR